MQKRFDRGNAEEAGWTTPAHGWRRNLMRAIDLYRELTELDPGDERLWRALFRLHAGRDDGSALVREESRMRAALRVLAAEVEDTPNPQVEEPSGETVQEYQRLLASVRDSKRQPAAV